MLGKEAEESFLIEMAEDISIATQQILSWSGDTMGFCDSGIDVYKRQVQPSEIHKAMLLLVLFSSYAWQFLLSLCRILTNTITINPINTVTRPATMEMPYRFAPTISL